eukprot:CAMPEP_0180531544 /NCGR_PEP_ID=MMETSP1036_2-20121128/62558_1 /TAXON_ID=632150 /ORGANISM="Azadinium spinosum, Strain 3D9" /LENGTH=71 /DNA_ID=CAMNT_0022545517 /DNA_START=603 /DNA_END=818 /DNA_ORIENTATION=-
MIRAVAFTARATAAAALSLQADVQLASASWAMRAELLEAILAFSAKLPHSWRELLLPLPRTVNSTLSALKH